MNNRKQDFQKPSFRKKSTLGKEQSTSLGESFLNDLDNVEERLLKLKSMVEKGLISKEKLEKLNIFPSISKYCN